MARMKYTSQPKFLILHAYDKTRNSAISGATD